jgi:hypothetical protein
MIDFKVCFLENERYFYSTKSFNTVLDAIAYIKSENFEEASVWQYDKSQDLRTWRVTLNRLKNNGWLTRWAY